MRPRKNLQQKLFAKEYLVDLNATQAAIRAGYSAKSAEQIGYQLLQIPSVREAIDKELAARSSRTQITADNVLREYARLAFSDIGQILDFSGLEIRIKPANEISDDARRSIQSFKVKRIRKKSKKTPSQLTETQEQATTEESAGQPANQPDQNDEEVEVMEFKLWSKCNALEKTAEHLGLLKKQLEITGNLNHEHTIAADIQSRIDALTAVFHQATDRDLEERGIRANDLAESIHPDVGESVYPGSEDAAKPETG